MPKLNLLNSETSEYFMKVAEFWVRKHNIDGWRFDVAFGIPFKFWKELRTRLKQIKPDLYLLGEFGNGNPDPSAWVGPETFDAVMNYPLRSIILDFVVFESISVEDFHQMLMELLGKLHHKAICSMYNLLGSHDTPRLLTICNGDVRKAKLAIFLQMTLSGAPAIYYGDEIGLKGGNDPDCRRTMEWNSEKWNLELIDYIKKLIKIRKEHLALATGKMEVVLKDAREQIYIFKRKNENDQAIVCINNSADAKVINIDSSKSFVEVLSGVIFQSSNGTLTINMPPKEGIILVENMQKFKSHRIT